MIAAMVANPTLPQSLSVYQVVRADPAAGPRLASMGLTRDFYDFRLCDAARAAHLPMEVVLSAIRGC